MGTAKQASQEGHIFCVQHFPWSRVSAHVTQEDSNAGDHHRHHMMLSEPPVGSDVSHAMGLAALIFKLSMERLSLCLASCPSRARAKGTSQWCPQRGPHSLSLCSDSQPSSTLPPRRGHPHAQPLQTLRHTEAIYISMKLFLNSCRKSKRLFLLFYTVGFFFQSNIKY